MLCAFQDLAACCILGQVLRLLQHASCAMQCKPRSTSTYPRTRAVLLFEKQAADHVACLDLSHPLVALEQHVHSVCNGALNMTCHSQPYAISLMQLCDYAAAMDLMLAGATPMHQEPQEFVSKHGSNKVCLLCHC